PVGFGTGAGYIAKGKHAGAASQFAEPDVWGAMGAVGDRTEFGLTAADRLRILSTCRTIAMVGLSSNPYAPSSFAAIYLAANGYNIVPVNPTQAGKTILGHPAYGSLGKVNQPVAIVDVFRPAHESPDVEG